MAVLLDSGEHSDQPTLVAGDGADERGNGCWRSLPPPPSERGLVREAEESM